jgi:hypothetical protein
MRVALAILLYFGVVFGAGFLLGPIRVVWLEPRLGLIVATACEAPFLLMAMLLAARWVPCVLNIRQEPKTLILVGIGALVLLQIADFTVGFWLRGITRQNRLLSSEPVKETSMRPCWPCLRSCRGPPIVG